MRRVVLVLSLLACALVICQPANARGNDEAQIRALEQRFAKAFNAKDVDAVMSNYLPGDKLFVFDVALPRQHVGFADYEKDWRDFFKMLDGPIKFEITNLSVTTGGGKLAYGHSIQHVTGTMDGKPLDLTVRVTDCYRKVNGKWLIAEEHVSVPVDMATGQADLQSKP